MNTTTRAQFKPASFGTVSHGTLRPEDLLARFTSELEWQILRNGLFLALPENFPLRDRLANLIGDAQDCFGDDGETLTEEGEAKAPDLIDEIMGALGEFAPAYGYFGTIEGDASDFGFWVDVDHVKEQVDFTSSEELEYPADGFVGEWLYVNERGNCTLYVRDDKGADREVWSIV